MGCWEITQTEIRYRGNRRDLSEFLPCFTIPVLQAWFDVLFRRHKEKKKNIYKADAYAVKTGYIVYDSRTTYSATRWADAMKTLGFAVQVEWAESPHPGTDRALAAMQVSILRPNQHRRKLQKQHTVGTTQGRFLAFLRSGNVEDLEGVLRAAA